MGRVTNHGSVANGVQGKTLIYWVQHKHRQRECIYVMVQHPYLLQQYRQEIKKIILPKQLLVMKCLF